MKMNLYEIVSNALMVGEYSQTEYSLLTAAETVAKKMDSGEMIAFDVNFMKRLNRLLYLTRNFTGEKASKIGREFCSLLLIDPVLAEAALGKKFEAYD